LIIHLFLCNVNDGLKKNDTFLTFTCFDNSAFAYLSDGISKSYLPSVGYTGGRENKTPLQILFCKGGVLI